MIAIYAAVLGLSAFLVFWIQPLVAKILLPLLGGAPAVWNTTILFFQGLLLVGYLYAHLIGRFSIRKQIVVHGIFLACAFVLLPTNQHSWTTVNQDGATLWLLGNLATFVGLPYVFLTSTAPLLQLWFGNTTHTGSRDPYFLYAASNAGSFLALLAFPIALERFFSVTDQIGHWRLGFIVLMIGLMLCASFPLRADIQANTKTADRSSKPGIRSITRWVTLAFFPSSLMLGVTTHITTDIASISFFWVVPLALYLATFVIAFSRVGGAFERASRRILPILLLFALFVSLRDGTGALLLVPTELLVVGAISMCLHAKLYAERPESRSLTNFYLWIAFGGFLGGLFNSILAPSIFDSVLEYPLVLAIGLIVVEWTAVRKFAAICRHRRWHGLKWHDVVAVLVGVVVFAYWVSEGELKQTALVSSLLFTSVLTGTYAFGIAYGGRLIVTLCFVLMLGFSTGSGSREEIYSDRSFFGSFSVMESRRGELDVRVLAHGTTLHGLQASDPEFRLRVQSYYAGVAPIFRRFLETRGPASIGVTGLGAGNLACLGRASDRVTFFEIDPAVHEVAREYFSYLDKCPPTSDVILGDARLQLQKIAGGSFDLLILDAFSSDSVPVHLLTREAAIEYERVLSNDGMLAFHISNRYLDLASAIEGLAADRGWKAWLIDSSSEPQTPLTRPSRFVILEPNEPIGQFVDNTGYATRLSPQSRFRVWTDDYSNLLEILQW